MITTKHFRPSLIMCGLLIMAACTSGNGHQQQAKGDGKDRLPENATEFLDENFSEVNIDTIKDDADDNVYEVELANGIEVDFEYDGDWRKVDFHKNDMDRNLLSSLPVRLTSYLKKNYPDFAIRKMRHTQHGYKIDLYAPEEKSLYFSRTGKYMPNQPNSLPSNVKVIMQKYFADDSICAVTVDEEKIYTIELCSGANLDFDRMGRFEGAYANKSTLPDGFINSFPSLMIGYVQKHYPDKVIKKIIRKSYGYYIKLSKPDPVELRFSKTGDYLREANKNEDDEQ
jgi:hypothetical protein